MQLNSPSSGCVGEGKRPQCSTRFSMKLGASLYLCSLNRLQHLYSKEQRRSMAKNILSASKKS